MGYARVSTSDQDLRMQRDALIAAGVDPRDIWEEKVSGASLSKRKQFHFMMKDVREGDIVYVWKLDRLARNAVDLYQTAKLIEDRGATLVVLTMPGMDTGTPVGRAMFGMLAVFAEFERAIAHERTMAGLRAARERGWTGRKSKFSDEEVLATQHLPKAVAARQIGITPAGYGKAAGQGVGECRRRCPFDLDPCAAPAPRPWPTATTHWTREDQPLHREWSGRVWLNPPFGPEAVVTAFMRRMAAHGNGTALLFARTETKLFFEAVWERATAILFLKGRPHFHHHDGRRARANSGAPVSLIAYGQVDADRLAASGIEGRLLKL
jgi:DNA invertase Pin-like site-specific DNA recombinase